MKKDIVITGASGFIGSNLVEKLLTSNSRIYALVRNPVEQTDERIVPVVGDVLKPEGFAPYVEKCNVVFHCAAHISFRKRDFQEAYQVNVEGTRNVLEAAYQAGVKKVVHLSACAVLGFSSDKNIVLDETADPVIDRDNVYAYSKKITEDKVQEYVQKGLDVSIANMVTVYGRGDRKLNSGSVVKSIHEGKMKVVPPGGTSFVAVEDVVDGLLLLAERGSPGERYIFCTENMEYAELARRIARALNAREPRYTLPRFTYYPALCAAKAVEMLSGFSDDRVNLVSTQILKETYGFKYFSSEKANRELGWQPRVDLEEAVRRAFEYYKREDLL